MRPLLAISALVAASSAAQAQAPTGRAALYSCVAGESCADTGDCATLPYTMFVMETFATGAEAGPTFFAGPLEVGAQAGLFFEQPLHPLHGATLPNPGKI